MNFQFYNQYVQICSLVPTLSWWCEKVLLQFSKRFCHGFLGQSAHALLSSGFHSSTFFVLLPKTSGKKFRLCQAIIIGCWPLLTTHYLTRCASLPQVLFKRHTEARKNKIRPYSIGMYLTNLWQPVVNVIISCSLYVLNNASFDNFCVWIGQLSEPYWVSEGSFKIKILPVLKQNCCIST